MVAFAKKTPHGTVELLGGLLEYDPLWRQRRLDANFDTEFLGRTLTKAQLAALAAVETAIEGICGKPGGGKSMYSTKLLVDELIYGRRPIVTNLALNLARLQEYLHELGFKVHVADRVRLLQKEEITEFYLRRAVGVTLELPSNGERFMDWTPSQNDERTAGGVMYIIDECHNYLHPQAFGQRLTPEHPLMQYATQHRKLKDTCYLVTQSIENVHVQVRRLCQQFSYIRNLRKETFRGFRRGEGFERTVYLTPPTSTEAVAIDTSRFSLDVAGLASCYYTAGGVGIAATGTGDGGAKKKGLNLKVLYALVFIVPPIVGIALYYGAKYSTTALVGQTVGIQEKAPGAKDMTAKNAEKVDTPKTIVPPQNVAAIATLPSETAARSQGRAPGQWEVEGRNHGYVLSGEKPEIIWVSGWVRAGDMINIVLSDGRTIDEGGDIERIERNRVVMRDGTIYWRGSPRSLPSAAQPAKQSVALPLTSGLPPAGSESLPPVGVPSEAEARSREAKTSQTENSSAFGYRAPGPSMSQFNSTTKGGRSQGSQNGPGRVTEAQFRAGK